LLPPLTPSSSSSPYSETSGTSNDPSIRTRRRVRLRVRLP
jgi:hypothetical protein